MPKPVGRVSDVRPKQAVFAASSRQHPQRLVMLTEGDSSVTGFRRLAENQWRPVPRAQFPGRGFA